MEQLDRWNRHFLHLFFPNLCYLCERRKPLYGHALCGHCLSRLPETQYHLHEENPFAERFWGRIPLYAGAACYFFRRGGLARQLIHRLKYEGRKELGVWVGKQYGRQLRKSKAFAGVEGIIPVPLHPRKQLQRGFNQSACFAAGLAESMGVPSYEEALIRQVHTETQTRKSSMERLQNVAKAFAVRQPRLLAGKHLLLVDDVLTTGATLEACALALLQVGNVKISMATIAIAE